MPPQPGEGSGYYWTEPNAKGDSRTKPPKEWSEADAFRNSLGYADSQVRDFMDVLQSEGRFKNKELDQRWQIAQLNERGANQRASSAAAASRYAADRSSRASMYGADKAAKASMYGADKSFEGVRYRTDADERMEGGKLGLGYLTTAANMRGPENYLQQADFLRGASQRQDVPIFMQNLLTGVSNAGFQAPGGAPAGLTMQGLIAKMTGGGAAGGAGGSGPTGQDATFLQSVRDLAQRGLHSLQPGALERLSPTELGVLKSATEFSGDGGPAWSWDDLMKQYSSSRIGQGSATAA